MDLSTREGRRQQGALLQEAARQAGLSAEELASVAECSRALVYQYYSGATLIQTDRLQRMARALGLPLAHFFGEQEGPARTPPPASAVTGPPAAQPDLPRPNLEQALRDLEELARAQEGAADAEGLARTCERIALLARFADRDALEAEASCRLGGACGALGRYAEAIGALERACELSRAIGDTPTWERARQSLGAALAAEGRGAEASAIFEELSRIAGPAAEWRARMGLAALAEQSAEYDRALSLLAEVLAAAEDAGSERPLARVFALANQSNVHLALGDYRAALADAEECEREADTCGLRDQRAEAMLNAGIALTGLGRYAESRERLGWAARLTRFAGDAPRALVAEAMLAWSECLAGRFEAARERSRRVSEEAAALGEPRAAALCHWSLARIEARGGGEGALELAREAERRLRALAFATDADRAAILLLELGGAPEGSCRGLAAIIEEARHRGALVCEAEARLAQALLGGALEEAARAHAIAERVGDPDLGLRAACAVSRLLEPTAEAAAWRVRACEWLTLLRAGDPEPGESALEDPLRLALCRLRLGDLLRTSPAEAERWLDDLAWPPVGELGPLEGWPT